MASHLALGFFAFYVTLVSLVRILTGQGISATNDARQIWDRRRRLLPLFLINVATPLVVGIVFVTRGIVGVDGNSATAYDRVPQQHVYHHIVAAREDARQAERQAEILLAAEWGGNSNLRWARVNLIP